MAQNFQCQRCGSCCYSPRLHKGDIERIKKAGYKEEDFAFTDNFGNKYMKDNKGWCMFLKRNKKNCSCAIYDFRPKTCRLYPNGFEGFIGGDCKPKELEFDRYMRMKGSYTLLYLVGCFNL